MCVCIYTYIFLLFSDLYSFQYYNPPTSLPDQLKTPPMKPVKETFNCPVDTLSRCLYKSDVAAISQWPIGGGLRAAAKDYGLTPWRLLERAPISDPFNPPLPITVEKRHTISLLLPLPISRFKNDWLANQLIGCTWQGTVKL